MRGCEEADTLDHFKSKRCTLIVEKLSKLGKLLAKVVTSYVRYPRGKIALFYPCSLLVMYITNYPYSKETTEEYFTLFFLKNGPLRGGATTYFEDIRSKSTYLFHRTKRAHKILKQKFCYPSLQ